MISISYLNCMKSVIGQNGLTPANISVYSNKIKLAQKSIEDRRKTGSLGFLELPYAESLVKKIQHDAKRWRGKYENFVVVGIGGSALGNIALQTALRHPHWNLFPEKRRAGWLKLFVLDNVDPTYTQGLLDAIDLKKTLINVISKSGTTAECLANYFIIRKNLEKKAGLAQAKKQLIFTTDPNKGYLREVAQKEKIQTYDVPSNVGGRFSVLSSVGLVSAAATGIDISQILDGAKSMAKRCNNIYPSKNPALAFALIHFLFYNKGRKIHAMFPYSNQLKDFADWFRQLWAESLGKKTSRAQKELFLGPTPIKALGVTDQHSQLQLYIEGPQDKVLTFLSIKQYDCDISMPKYNHHYLGGQSIAQLFKAEEKATIAALSKEGRPNLTISLPAVTPFSVGELIFMLELATAYAGEFFNVNAFDQPGVEQGKLLTYALMGRAGFDKYLNQYRKWLK